MSSSLYPNVAEDRVSVNRIFIIDEHTTKEAFDIESIIDASLQFALLAEVVDPDLIVQS
jgi:hypothetical protein